MKTVILPFSLKFVPNSIIRATCSMFYGVINFRHNSSQLVLLPQTLTIKHILLTFFSFNTFSLKQSIFMYI
jgi:hypothetical protein